MFRAPGPWPGAEPALLSVTGEGHSEGRWLLGSESGQQDWVTWVRQLTVYDWKARRFGMRAH